MPPLQDLLLLLPALKISLQLLVYILITAEFPAAANSYMNRAYGVWTSNPSIMLRSKHSGSRGGGIQVRKGSRNERGKGIQYGNGGLLSFVLVHPLAYSAFRYVLFFIERFDLVLSFRFYYHLI